MTARVIHDIGAHVLGLVEVEDRPSLLRFNRDLLGGLYRHVMLVDGNDDRGIDVAIMTRNRFEIGSIRSNVDKTDSKGIIFSRDCAEYEVRTPKGAVIHVLVNHNRRGRKGKRQRQQFGSSRCSESKAIPNDCSYFSGFHILFDFLHSCFS